jgi:hypothetical protein
VLCVGDVGIRDVEDCNNENQQTEYHRNETVLIIVKLFHVSIDYRHFIKKPK